MKRILFQGDSITDAGRDRNSDDNIGVGYPNLVAATLGHACPGEYEFINRGISGNRIVDVYARIKKDITNLKPDYLSILIGVNDVWHEYNYQNGVDTPRFEAVYTMLLEDIIAECPNTKIMLMEPYVLPGVKTVPNFDEDGNEIRHPLHKGEEPLDRWTFFKRGVIEKLEATRRLGKKFGLPVVPLNEVFDKAYEKTGDSRIWTLDGVHPTPAGHKLIENEWLKYFEKIK